LSSLSYAFQIDINLDGWKGSDLRDLEIEVGNEDVQELMDWRRVSDFWPEQPRSDTLQVFVKILRRDEQGECVSLVVSISICGIADIFAYSLCHLILHFLLLGDGECIIHSCKMNSSSDTPLSTL
jgi:hypothetical protein